MHNTRNTPMTHTTNRAQRAHGTQAFALAILTAGVALGGCSGMSRSEVSTAAGAAVGAVAGAAVGGTAATVGGAVIGGVVGNEIAKKK